MTSLDFDSRPSWRSYWLGILLGILLAVTGVGLLILGWVFWDRLGNRYKVQSGKIESRKGVISKNLKSVRLENLRDIELNQSVLQRLLGIGNLSFSTAGSIGAEVVFDGIANPQDLKDSVEGYMAESRSQ